MVYHQFFEIVYFLVFIKSGNWKWRKIFYRIYIGYQNNVPIDTGRAFRIFNGTYEIRYKSRMEYLLSDGKSFDDFPFI
jgi:hypothetical protein